MEHRRNPFLRMAIPIILFTMIVMFLRASLPKSHCPAGFEATLINDPPLHGHDEYVSYCVNMTHHRQYLKSLPKMQYHRYFQLINANFSLIVSFWGILQFIIFII